METEEQSRTEKLIEVAGEIFANKGRAATVREICSAAGASVAAINYHFGDKNQLYVQCVRTACERKQKLFPLPEMDKELASPESILQIFLRTITQRLLAKGLQPWHNTLLLREVLSPTDGVAEMLSEAFRKDFGRLDAVVGTLLGELLNTPERRTELTTQIVARCMFLRTGKNMRSMVGLDSMQNEEPEQYADSICQSILLQVNALRAVHQQDPLPCPVSSRLPQSSTVENSQINLN